MSEHSEVIPNGKTEPSTVQEQTAPRQPDWRNEPRKSKDERFARTIYARVPKSTKDALRQLAAQRGETEAQYIRDLIDWQTRAVLREEADAEMRAPPAQAKAELQLAETYVKVLIKACRSQRRPPRDDWS